MHKTCLLPALAVAAFVCGCDKQAKINNEKIQILSQNIVQFEQGQARQMALMQTQLNALAPMLDRMDSSYFEKNHDAEFFYHTNTLYLLLMVDKKIETHLQVADTEREAESSLAFYYHTNQTGMMYLYATQIQDALNAQEGRVEDKVNAETRQAGATLGDQLLKQIKLSAPDAAEIARRRQMEADVAQIKRDLQLIKLQFGLTNNPPAAWPW
jgi:hypothetical protein